MSLQFRPPTASETETHWRDLVRIGPDDDSFWRRIRQAQLDFLRRYYPFIATVGIANTIVVLASLAHRAPLPVLIGWFTVIVGMTIYFGVCQARDAIRGRKAEPTRAFFIRVLLEIAPVGMAWGILFWSIIPAIDQNEVALVVGMTLMTIGTTAYATAIVPLAGFALFGPIALGCILGFAGAPWPHADLVLLITVTFFLMSMRGNVLTTFAFLARIKTQDRLVAQEQVLRLLLTEFEANGSEWLYEFDRDGRLSFVSSRFGEVVGQPVESLLGRTWPSFITQEAHDALMAVVVRGQAFRDLLIPVEVNGEERCWSLSGTPKFDAEGRFDGYRGVGSDVTERERSARRIEQLATFDTLTGLVNRRILHAGVEDGLRSPGGVTLMFVDLDRFKAVNDTLGHAAGDQLLVEVAQRLRRVVGDSGQVGRLGGDEFAIILRAVAPEDAIALGERVITALSEPFTVAGKEARIGASIGLAVGPSDATDVEGLMRAADLALYDVKGKGRGSVRRYDRELHARAEERRALELDLRSALEHGQLYLVYQPVVDTLDERVVAFEALMRWRHPQRGELSPGVFIPIAEETGLIIEMGRFALDEALRTAARWPRHIRISVNISPLQVEDPGLVEDVRAALRRSGVTPDRLELELTESVFLDQRPTTSETLRRLRDIGVGFALDDFGTGYSSLGYLQKIAFNRIKIDRSFVKASTKDADESVAIIQAIVSLADRLGMETTAEGTETRAEFEAMRRLGCAHVQGFYFGRPMGPDDALRYIRRDEPLIAIDDDALAEAIAAVQASGDLEVGSPVARSSPSDPGAGAQLQEVAAPASRPLRAGPRGIRHG
jgi:diguanylate cyclase (GGDEF)-like protein/PAS domain S-box-containing protein